MHFELVLQLQIFSCTLLMNQLSLFISSQSETQVRHFITWDEPPKHGAKVCKGDHMGVRGAEREQQAIGKSNMEYQQREATPPRCTQSEDEQDKNLTYVCFIFECHRHPSLIHKLHLTCISHHLCYHSENKYKDGETCKSIHEKINLN